MFASVSVAIAVLIAALVVGAARKPATFHVERTTRIQAPPERLFELISDFKNWRSWSPYENSDPHMQRTFSGAHSGVGAVYEWRGKGKVGAGRMEITAADARMLVLIKLDFLKPIKASNFAEFTLESQGVTTSVTWATYGPASILSRLIAVFVSLDKMIGRDFEKGLDNLKTVAERQRFASHAASRTDQCDSPPVLESECA